MNWPLAQDVNGEQPESEVNVASVDWNCADVQVVIFAHTIGAAGRCFELVLRRRAHGNNAALTVECGCRRLGLVLNR